MYEPKHKPLLPAHLFLRRTAFHFFVGILLIIFSLLGGIFGYVYFGRLNWIESFENAAMILSGMGPVTDMTTNSGKIFAGVYALFSGIIFLGALAIIFAPIFHRFLHKFVSKEIK